MKIYKLDENRALSGMSKTIKAHDSIPIGWTHVAPPNGSESCLFDGVKWVKRAECSAQDKIARVTHRQIFQRLNEQGYNLLRSADPAAAEFVATVASGGSIYESDDPSLIEALERLIESGFSIDVSKVMGSFGPSN